MGQNDWGLGAKRLGCRGETSRHQIWGETTRGELVLGRNDLLPCVYDPLNRTNWQYALIPILFYFNENYKLNIVTEKNKLSNFTGLYRQVQNVSNQYHREHYSLYPEAGKYSG